MAIYLRTGPPDQQGWINFTGERMPDGRYVVLIKEGVRVSAPMLQVLNALMSTEGDLPAVDGCRITGTG